MAASSVRLHPARFLMIEVDPGPHVVSAVAAMGSSQAQQIDAAAGQCYFVKMWMHSLPHGLAVEMQQITNVEGRDLVQRYRMAAPAQGQ